MSYDEDLKRVLSEDDEAFLKRVEDDRGLFTQYFAAFHGPMGMWMWFVLILTFVTTGIAVWASYRFIIGAEVVELLKWGAAAWAAWTAQVALKQWAFDRINHVATLRELKKIELRLVHLEERGG